MIGLRNKGYSPIQLGTFSSPHLGAPFARDIKPNSEDAASLVNMERKRKELLQKTKAIGADSLLILDIGTMRIASQKRVSSGEVTSSAVPSTRLWCVFGWLDLNGQYLQWTTGFLSQRESVEFGQPTDGGVLGKRSVIAIDLPDEVWTADFPDEILKRISSFR